MRCILTPSDNYEVDLGNGIVFVKTCQLFRNSSNTVSEIVITIKLHASGVDAAKRIDAFVDQAFQFYQDVTAAADKNVRYLMCMKAVFTDESTETKTKPKPVVKSHGLRFARYILSDDKTFESLFLPQKRQLIDMLDDFTAKRGKYAIAGFPNKLGFMLYGPPGTGKTSLIKAIAHRTKRHIVSIPLKRIKTNEEIMELLFGGQYLCENQDLPMYLPFNKLIFVMEDVDASGDVVHNRGEEPQDKPSEIDDALDLAGLLNALDGVADSPGRIVIMTTNHPDKLDPALTRPGRVNMTLHLSYMQRQQMLEMIEHYFGPGCMDESSLTIPNQLTPAQLEEMCIACATPSDLAHMLNTMGL